MDRPPMSPEHHVAFPCFGGTCAVHVSGHGPLGPAPLAAETVRRQLLRWHERFSRFLPDSELSRLNRSGRRTVDASPELVLLAAAIVDAAHRSGGLVDATCVDELRAAGYDRHLEVEDVPRVGLPPDAPARRPAGPDPRRRWAGVEVDRRAGTITRDPGVLLDSGGLAKGLFADLIADRLAGYERFVVDCCGDLRLGGTRGATREVRIAHPTAGPGAEPVHVFARTSGGVATSSVARRRWTGPDDLPAHHLLDPATGRPAFTGVLQATALAPTAVEAEWRSTAALLAGPEAAAGHLPHGGVVVLDDLEVRVVEPTAARPRGRAGLRDGRLVLTGPAA